VLKSDRKVNSNTIYALQPQLNINSELV